MGVFLFFIISRDTHSESECSSECHTSACLILFSLPIAPPAPSLSRGTPSLHGPDTPNHKTEDISFLSMLPEYRSHAGGGPPRRADPPEAACTRPGHSAGLRGERALANWLWCQREIRKMEPPITQAVCHLLFLILRTAWDSEPRDPLTLVSP